MRPISWALSLCAVFAASASAQHSAELRLDINIPAYRLEVYQDSTRVRQYVVAVGEAAFPTPIGQFAVTWIEWNPWWVPPSVDWANADTVTPPGPQNPMGRVKLWFYGDYFIHGTAEVTTVGTAASHGCVRLANADAVNLAVLVHRFASLSLAQTDLERLAAGNQGDGTRRIVLDEAVPLVVRYDVVEIERDRLVIYEDLYGLVSEPLVTHVLRTLLRRGYDTAGVNVARIQTALERHDRPAVVPLIELLSRSDSQGIRWRDSNHFPRTSEVPVRSSLRSQPDEMPADEYRQAQGCRGK